MPPVIQGADSDLPEEVTVLVNKSMLVECLSSGSPTPRNSWQKDGQFLLEDEHHKFLSNGRILQVKVKNLIKNSYLTLYFIIIVFLLLKIICLGL